MRPTLGNLQSVAAAIAETKGPRTTLADIREFFPDQPEETLLDVLIWALRREMVIANQRELLDGVLPSPYPEAGPLLEIMEGGQA